MEATKKRIKKLLLTASFEAGACHVGSALSCLDVMVFLFYALKIKPEQFIFSKASGVATYYAILADLGYFDTSQIAYYLERYPLPSKEVPGVIHSVGSLGHGLPVAVGLAYAQDTDIYILMSDGECQEGTTYESALFARQHKLNNLHVFIDDNKIQALGYTKDILDLTTAYEFLKKTLPNVVILDTIKGQGVKFMEGKADWHYKNLTKALLKKCKI